MTLAVYLAPQPDELLSSWVMRTCHANATSFYSLLWHHKKSSYAQTDIDQCKSNELLVWLAKELKHPEGYKGAWDMSLLPVKELETEFPHRSWIRGIDRRAFKWRAFRYCPACLKSDIRPYFRQYWRLDWYEACHHHQVQMHSSCFSCKAPLILHRIKWNEPHLAHCNKCHADLIKTPEVGVNLDQQTLTTVNQLLLLIKNQDKELYSAIHFIEAFLDELCKKISTDDFISNLTTVHLSSKHQFLHAYPLLMRTINAYRLWVDDKKVLTGFISKNQKYFNLAVRSFGCPSSVNLFHKPLKYDVELSSELLAKASKEIEATGRKATTKRISKHLTCSHAKLERFLIGLHIIK